jgi:hypothetical protein
MCGGRSARPDGLNGTRDGRNTRVTALGATIPEGEDDSIMNVEFTGLLSAGRRLVAGLAIAGLLGVSLAGAALADDQIAASGNGGTSTNSANGGAVNIGDGNSGGTTGATISSGASAEDIIAAVYESLGLPIPE